MPHLLIGIALQKLRRIPAGDAGHTEGRERSLQGLRLARKFVAQLHALEARLARLGQAGLERCLAANLLQIIVRPADGVRSDTDRHSSSLDQ